jgi:DNA-binding transcriptional regulator YiaG
LTIDFCEAEVARSMPNFFCYARADMSPEGIKALRQELGCTARELAAALGLDQETVLAWERGDLFPTKRLVGKMEELRHKGPSAIPKRKRGQNPAPLELLASPDLWLLLRKLIAHPELRTAAMKLAESYPDPTEEPRA